MEQLFYQRPREKLDAKGAAHLTTIELLQIVLGSGNAKASGARLAKRVATTINKGKVTLADLMHIEGIGFAKACQTLAAMELGVRLSQQSAISTSEVSGDNDFKIYISSVSVKNNPDAFIVRMYDGAGGCVLQKEYSTFRGQFAIRQVCEDTLSTSARMLDVAIVVPEVGHATSVPPGIDVLKQLLASVAILGIQLRNVYAMSKHGVEKWKV